jgi:hypothetical protein
MFNSGPPLLRQKSGDGLGAGFAPIRVETEAAAAFGGEPAGVMVGPQPDRDAPVFSGKILSNINWLVYKKPGLAWRPPCSARLILVPLAFSRIFLLNARSFGPPGWACRGDP